MGWTPHSRSARLWLLCGVLLVLLQGARPSLAVTRPVVMSELRWSVSGSAVRSIELRRPLSFRHFEAPPELAKASGGIRALAILPPIDQPQDGFAMIVRTDLLKGGWGTVSTSELRPGRYRLAVLADGPGSILLRLPGTPKGKTTLSGGSPYSGVVARKSLDSRPRVPGDVSLFDSQALESYTRAMVVFAAAGDFRATTLTYTCAYAGRRQEPFLPLCSGGSGLGVGTPINPQGPWRTQGYGVWDFAPGEGTYRVESHSVGTVSAATADFFWFGDE